MGHRRHDVVARLEPTVLDVVREPVVEELQWLVRHHAAVGVVDGAVVALELLAELRPVLVGNPEQVRDDEQRKEVRVLVDELALAAVDELVDLAIRQSPHGLLVLLEPLRRDQPHQQAPLRGVPRRIERRQLIAERKHVAVLLDDPAHVVTLERDGERREWARHRVARREGHRVVVHRHHFLEARDHEDAVMGLLPHRTVRAEVLVVRVRVLVERPGAEVVDGVEIRRVHRCAH